MAKKTVPEKNGRKQEAAAPAKPKRVSKIAEWWEKNPNGLTVNYIDWKAIMR